MGIKLMTSQIPGMIYWLPHLLYYIELVKMCYDDEFEKIKYLLQILILSRLFAMKVIIHPTESP